MERTKISYLTVFRKCQRAHTANNNNNAVDELASIPTVIVTLQMTAGDGSS
jgi:hypothetical protein